MPMMDNMVKAVNSGYVLVALDKFIPQFVGTPLETAATNVLNAQANYIIANLKDPNGGYYTMYTIGTGADTSAKKMMSNAAVIRGLYAAYHATNNAMYLTEANDAFNYFITNFYMSSDSVFKTEEGSMSATYTPKNLAILAGVLREANLVGGQTTAKDIYAAVFETIYNKMILTEAGASGETGSDSDGDGIPFIVGGTKPFVYVAEATFDITAGVDNVDLGIDNLVLYPNPTQDKVTLNITLNKKVNINIAVIDIQGRSLYSNTKNNLFQGNQAINIPLTNLDNGIYFVKITVNNKLLTTEKLIKF